MASVFHQISKGISIAGQSAAPAGPVNGDIYYDTTLNQFRFYQFGSWVTPGSALSLAPIGVSPNANGLTITGSVLNLEPASASFPGAVTIGAQVFAGAKQFNSTILIAAGSNLALAGATSGVVTIAQQAVAGTFNFNLPITAGTAGQVLTSGGGVASPMTWSAGSVISEYDAGNSGASLTVDFVNGPNQRITLTNNCTFTFSNPINGSTYLLKLIQDGVGSRLVTWPASVKWNGTAPTLSTAIAKIDLISFYYDGTNYFGTSSIGY